MLFFQSNLHHVGFAIPEVNVQIVHARRYTLGTPVENILPARGIVTELVTAGGRRGRHGLIELGRQSWTP